MDESLNAPVRDFVALFERLGIPSALIGGLAVSVHGIPRPTHDLDFTIALGEAALATVRAQLKTRRPRSGSPTASRTRGSWISRPPCGSAPFAALTPQSHTAESHGGVSGHQNDAPSQTYKG